MFVRRAILGLCLVVTHTALVAFAAESPRPPNIVLMLADDLGYGALSCYGQQHYKTPNLDRLAAEGLRLTQAYAGCHVCQPSRCVLMTGLHTGHCAVRANDHDQMLQPQDVTIADVLRQGGYATGMFGKWGLGFEGTTGHPRRQGFDQFFGQLLQVHAHFYYPFWVWQNEERFELTGNRGGRREQYVQDEVQARALEFIREHRDQPFFAYIGYTIPHVELVVPEESERPYRGRFPRRSIQDPRPGYLGSADGLATYAGMVSRLDQHVGQVLDLLEELDLADDTLVIFTSDNGGQNGGQDQGWTAMTDFFSANGPLRGYKGTFYEGGLRVPLLARWPERFAAGRKVDAVCGFQDLLPTLAAAAHRPALEGLDGLSQLPIWRDLAPASEPRLLYWEYPVRRGIGRAAREGRYKIIQARPDGPLELYDLEQDVGETHDLASRQPEVVERLTAAMNAARTNPREFAPQALKPTLDDFVQ